MDRSKWEYKRLGEICDKGSSNIAQNKIEDITGEYPLYGASGYVKGINFYHQEKPYIGIVKDGSGVGRANLYPAKSSLLGTMQYILPKDGCELGFLLYVIKGLQLEKYKTGAAIPHIYFKDYGKSIVPFPPIEDQQRIVAELDCLNEMIALKREQLKEFDKLAQSIFYDMFGDSVSNEKGWEKHSLGKMATFKNGLNFKPVDEGNSIKILGVSDFQDLKEIKTADSLSLKCIKETIDDDYYLTAGDIVIVRSNGSKKLVGRNVLIRFKDKNVAYSGFCIRCRLTSDECLPLYLNFVLSTPSMKELMTSGGRGCNIANINQQALNKLMVPLPPLTLQQQFADKISAIEAQKELVKQSIAETQSLFNSRMDYFFN